jgi:hypothetical protein
MRARLLRVRPHRSQAKIGSCAALHVDAHAEVLESGPVYDNVWWHNTLFHGPAVEHRGRCTSANRRHLGYALSARSTSWRTERVSSKQGEQGDDPEFRRCSKLRGCDLRSRGGQRSAGCASRSRFMEDFRDQRIGMGECDHARGSRSTRLVDPTAVGSHVSPTLGSAQRERNGS